MVIKLFDLVDFGFNEGSKKKKNFSIKMLFDSTRIKNSNKIFFTKTSLKQSVKFLIEMWTVDVAVIRRDLVLTIFRNQFSLYKLFNSYFRILIFILVDGAVC